MLLPAGGLKATSHLVVGYIDSGLSKPAVFFFKVQI